MLLVNSTAFLFVFLVVASLRFARRFSSLFLALNAHFLFPFAHLKLYKEQQNKTTQHSTATESKKGTEPKRSEKKINSISYNYLYPFTFATNNFICEFGSTKIEHSNSEIPRLGQRRWKREFLFCPFVAWNRNCNARKKKKMQSKKFCNCVLQIEGK